MWWTKGECYLLVLFTSPRWDYYSLVKNWAHISYAWTHTSRGDSLSVHGMPNRFDWWAYLASLFFLQLVCRDLQSVRVDEGVLMIEGWGICGCHASEQYITSAWISPKMGSQMWSCLINRLPCQALRLNLLIDFFKAVATDQLNIRRSWQMSFARLYYPLNPNVQAPDFPVLDPTVRVEYEDNEIVRCHHEYLQ